MEKLLVIGQGRFMVGIVSLLRFFGDFLNYCWRHSKHKIDKAVPATH